MLRRRISTPVALRLVLMIVSCFAFREGDGQDSICMPRESLPQGSMEFFDPSKISTAVTLTPVCAELTEPRVQAVVVDLQLRTIIGWTNSTDEKFFFGYVCDGNVTRNFSLGKDLPRGANGEWTGRPQGAADPLPLAVGDYCQFFGCYEYVFSEGPFVGGFDTYYVANFEDTSCVIDLDECSDGSAQCGQYCVNVVNGTANSYQCTCRQGFSLSEDQHNCTDVDECAMGVHTCDQICNVSTDGWYNCSCRDGFTLDQDEHTCNDIDECLSNGTVLCDTDRTGRDCTNTRGSYQCTCRDGFQLDEDQLICVDIDECGDDTAQCQQLCHNTEGSYNCSCSTWYSFVGPFNCTEIDVCTELAVECGGHSKCMNMPEEEEGYRCVCDSGYEKKGISCSLIGIVHVYWVAAVLMLLMIALLLGCVFVLRRKYLEKKHDLLKRYNILFKYQIKKEEVDPSYNPLDFDPVRKVSYAFSLVSTLETYECPSYPIIHEPDDEEDYEPSSNTHLYSTNGILRTRDDEHTKRELSAIMEDNEDGASVNKDMEEFTTEVGGERKDMNVVNSPGYVSQAEDFTQRVLNPSHGANYDVDHGCSEIWATYVEEEPPKHLSGESLQTPSVDREEVQPSSSGYIEECTPDRVGLRSSGAKEVVETNPAEQTQSEPYAQLNLPITSVGILQTSPYLTEMDKEQCPLGEPPADSGCSLDMLETDPHMTSLSTYPTGTNTALNDGYIPSDSSTASSGYASVASYLTSTSSYTTDASVAPNRSYVPSNFSTASSGYASESGVSSYKSHLTSTSSFANDESAVPKSSYIPSSLSTASSGYASESGVSMYQRGSVASQMSCGTPQMPHFGNGWANNDYVTDTSLCGSPVALRKIPEVSGYVTESLEPVLTHSLGKHSVDHKHSEDTIDSAVCIDTPDVYYVDSVFNEDQYILHTGSTTHDDLDSERAATESDCDKRSSTVVPLASSGQDEAALHDRSFQTTVRSPQYPISRVIERYTF